MAFAEQTSLRQLLEAGVHFGHQTQRWNPKMAPFIYGERNGIHIFDLTQTLERLNEALRVVREQVQAGGRVLFVGTKRQAQKPVASAAEASAQFYVNVRWLGGTLTNWKTISNSIDRLKAIDENMAAGAHGLTKRERLDLERQQNKLNSALGGIREMGRAPDLMFVIDTNKEALAVLEAKKLGIPVVAVVDSNSDPSEIDYPIPGNDDASRAIALYCDLVARAAIDGMEAQLSAAGVDLGEASAPQEAALAGSASEADGAGADAGADEAADGAQAAEAKPDGPKVETKPAKKTLANKPSGKEADSADSKASDAKEPRGNDADANASSDKSGKASDDKASQGEPDKDGAADKGGAADEKLSGAKGGAKDEDEKDAQAGDGAKDDKAGAGADAGADGADNAKKPGNLLTEAKGEADDLKLISGVGPKLEGLLHENGVFHFWQIAEWTGEEIGYMDDKLSFKGRIERDNWIEQARNLAKEKASA